MEKNYYAIYNQNTGLLYKAQVKHLNKECVNIPVEQEVYDNLHKYNYVDGELVFNTNYDLEQEELEKKKEQERIGNLKVTKRVFALALRDNFGIPYQKLKQEIAQSDDAQLEWDLCGELHRNNPLLDIMAAKIGITPQQIDYIFRAANGEDVTLQVKTDEELPTNETVLPEEPTENTLYT